MYRILQQKKVMVVDGLLGVLSHKNRSNMDDSINATEILIELVEIEKTFDIFMMNKGEKVGTIMELAVDCSNCCCVGGSNGGGSGLSLSSNIGGGRFACDFASGIVGAGGFACGSCNVGAGGFAIGAFGFGFGAGGFA